MTGITLAGLAPLICAVCLLQCSPAAADNYPVNGVWVSPDPEFPMSIDGACFSLRISGIQPVAKKLIAELLIFNGNTRYDLKGNVQVVSTLLSAKPTDGGYLITEQPNVRAHFWFRKKTSYFLAMVDSMTIEIRDRLRRTRFQMCVPRGKVPA
jgi:hypothetical protein